MDNGIPVLELTVGENNFEFTQSISSALERAELELSSIENEIAESENTLKALTPQCDKIDYILAASSGALCGIFDIFLVGKPGESPFGDITDKWFESRTKDFAKLCNWDSSKDDSLKSAISHLEKMFKIPYDQRGAGDAASFVFDLNPGNHHFKSLGHNPTLLGLFFSILDAKAKNVGAGAAGAGLGVAVVTMGPTVAMGVATTFGVASTGTAISTLSGAAATNAALAWLGGGALAAGGGGMAAGNAFLALAGPIGGGYSRCCAPYKWRFLLEES